MSAGWVAGSVRARAIARRRIGADAARRLAACGSLADALAALAQTPYGTGLVGGAGNEPAGEGSAGADAGPRSLEHAQHSIAAALLWDLRVLAGWLPQGGTQLMRVLAGWFELANVSELAARLDGRPAGELFTLGVLGTAWPQLRRASSHAELRAALAGSAWQDPGGDTLADLEVGMRARWAQRVAALGGAANVLAASALVLLLAGERFGAKAAAARPTWAAPTHHAVLDAAAVGLLGEAAAAATTFGELADRLPNRLAWVVEPAAGPADLWRSEAAWWRRAEREAHELLANAGFDSGPVIGAAIMLAVDARRTSAALEMAARGGGPIEAFDAVAGGGVAGGAVAGGGVGSGGVAGGGVAGGGVGPASQAVP